MIFKDMREFIVQVERAGECKVLEGADWNLEIGLITEWQSYVPNSPMLVFDRIKGYPAGYRVVTNAFSSPLRTALALGLPGKPTGMELVRQIKDSIGRVKMIPPVETNFAPVKENVHLGDEIDLFEFPSPIWRSRDGGRFIGTGVSVIMKELDGAWVNVATYRVQVQSKNTVGLYIKPGSHGNLILRKWWARGLPCPVAIATGCEPMLYAASSWDIEYGVSEYDFAGGLRGEPVEVIRGLTVDLPIPATAEIVLEGELVKGETADEGPFGEYAGYYAGGKMPRPLIRVNAVLHRNNPIIHGAPPAMSGSTEAPARAERKAALVWSQLAKLVPGIKGVWQPDYAPMRPVIVSLEQQYLGHAKQAAMAVHCVSAGGIAQPYVIVVDDDIDPSNLNEVLWALTTRCDPERSIDVVRGLRTNSLQPPIHPDKRARGDFTCSSALILACRPYEWRNEFPATIKSSPEELKAIEEKWGHHLKEQG